MADWRIEGIEVGERASNLTIASHVGQAVRAARDESLVTILSIDGAQQAAIVPLDDHGYPVAMGRLEVALDVYDRARIAEDHGWSRSAQAATQDALRQLAEAVRAEQARQRAVTWHATGTAAGEAVLGGYQAMVWGGDNDTGEWAAYEAGGELPVARGSTATIDAAYTDAANVLRRLAYEEE